MRRPLIAGNWKMYTSAAEARSLAAAVVAASRDCGEGRDVLIAPPFIHLSTVAEILKGSGVLLAGQNVAWAREGAFTGEVSPVMLLEGGCAMAIIGHSERRQIFGETDAIVNRRIQGAMEFGLVPVFCIGETLDERESGLTFEILERQMREGLKGVKLAGGAGLVLAYEPVWAIGTGRTATAEQAQEVHAFLRNLVAKLYEKNIATHMRILYGGSVKPDNIDNLMQQPDVDGALVGGAALNPESFGRIIRFR